MGEGTADGRERGGEPDAVGRSEEAKAGMLEDANSQRSQEPVRAAGNDNQRESSSVQKPGMASAEAEKDEGSNHLFTDAMKLQLRAQILILGDLLKGTAPNPDWLEDACLESAIGAESVLLEPVEFPRGAQDVQFENTGVDGIPAESNVPRTSSTFRDAGARMSSFSGAADLPTTRDAVKDELHAARRFRLSTPGEPSSSGKEFGFRDDNLAQETEMVPSGQLLITYDHTRAARSNSNMGEDSRAAAEDRNLESDRHLDMAQASAQDALTTATSALAQSHMVWARLHSQDHSEEGVARDARLASVAATVAAASSVAKAAVEAARAIAEVSMDAFIQASGYQLGDARTLQFGSTRSRPLQVDGWARENASPSQQRADMLESVVQAAGKAAEAATQAGAVLAKANPMIQTGLAGFWPQRAGVGDVEHKRDEANEMDAADEVDNLEGKDHESALNETDAVNEADGANEEDAAEDMEDIQEGDTAYQDKLDDAMNDVHDQVIANQAEAGEDGVAAANEGELAAANGDGVVGANEAGVAAVNEDQVLSANEDGMVGANEDGVVGANEVAEPIDQDKGITPRSTNFKRGRGRSRGFSSRAKRAKIAASVSVPPYPAQSPENPMPEEVDVSQSLKVARDQSPSEKKRGAKHSKNAPVSISGVDASAIAPAQGLDDAAHQILEGLEIQKNVPDRTSRAQTRGARRTENKHLRTTGEDVSATAPVHTPEDETLKQDDVPTKRNNARGKNRAVKHTENKPLSTPGENMPAPTLGQSPENEVHRLDDVSRKNAPGRKRGAKHVENRPLSPTGQDMPASEPAESQEIEVHNQDDVSTIQKNDQEKNCGAQHIENTSGKDILATPPAQSPENELHKKEEVPKGRKNAQGGNARGRTRRGKHVERTTVRDTADRDSRGAETETNTREVPESAIQNGSAVEVMIDEVGLRGGWFSGTVQRIITNEVFVELHDLLTDDGKTNVREWFPLVEGFNPCHPRRHARPVHPFTIFNEAGSRKRRRVALGSQTWHVGDQVDAFIQDAWWEGIVAEINDLDPSKATVYFPEENDTQIVKTWDLRPSFRWNDNKWMPWKSPALVEDERPQKRHRIVGLNKVARSDDPISNDKSSEGRPESSRMQEEIPEPQKSPGNEQQGSKTLTPQSNWKSKKKNAIPERKGRGVNKAHQTEVLPPGTSEHLDSTPDAAAPTAPAPAPATGKTPLTKLKKRRRRKKYT